MTQINNVAVVYHKCQFNSATLDLKTTLFKRSLCADCQPPARIILCSWSPGRGLQTEAKKEGGCGRKKRHGQQENAGFVMRGFPGKKSESLS